MTKTKICMTTGMSIVAILAIVPALGIQFEDVVAKEIEKKDFKRVDGITVYGMFEFYNGSSELTEFQFFEQKSGFDLDSKSAEFVLEKIAGETPMLYEWADSSRLHTNSGNEKNDFPLSVKITIAKDGNVIREFEYFKCTVTDYKVKTWTDKEEGWTGKSGFAVVDSYEFDCNGYHPSNPTYDKMNMPVRSDNTNSMDLIPTDTWPKHMKTKN